MPIEFHSLFAWIFFRFHKRPSIGKNGRTIFGSILDCHYPTNCRKNQDGFSIFYLFFFAQRRIVYICSNIYPIKALFSTGCPQLFPHQRYQKPAILTPSSYFLFLDRLFTPPIFQNGAHCVFFARPHHLVVGSSRLFPNFTAQ